MTQRVLVTGANGFVGRELCSTLVDDGYVVRAALRDKPESWGDLFERVVVGDLHGETDWNLALRNVDVVIHLAARAHVLGDPPSNAYLYMQTNADATRRLAEMSARAGVHRFVLMSSVKVNGENSGDGLYGPTDEPGPCDAYGRSKALAEEYLRAVAKQTEMEAVCIRAPLVYGAGVRANFLRLLRWVDQERLMPFGAINNRRSLVSTWNLCHLLVRRARRVAISKSVAPVAMLVVLQLRAHPALPRAARGVEFRAAAG